MESVKGKHESAAYLSQLIANATHDTMLELVRNSDVRWFAANRDNGSILMVDRVEVLCPHDEWRLHSFLIDLEHAKKIRGGDCSTEEMFCWRFEALQEASDDAE